MSRTLSRLIVLCVVLFASISTAWGTVRLVPEVYPTICDAVAVAVSGDIVSIAPGTYRESCTLSVDGVVLESRDQAATTATTIITGDNGDGSHRCWVFRCAAGTGPTTEIRYLTITGTQCLDGPAGGIVVDSGADVTIRDNIITDNSNGGMTGETAGGICCLSGSSATIRNNSIVRNWGYWGGGAIACHVNCTVVIQDNELNGNGSRYWGGAIHCGGGSDVLIQGNEIVGNDDSEYSAGAIYTEGASCRIIGNYIAHNTSGITGGSGWQARGGGISVENYTASTTTAEIINNILLDNRVTASGSGGAINIGGPFSGAIATIVNNTIYGNLAGLGSGIHVDSTAGPVTISNNLVAAGLTGAAFTFDKAATADYNDLWNNPSDYEGFAVEGPHDLHADPLFVSSPPVTPSNFDLQLTSPCIDAGTNSGAPSDDYFGRPRPRDGDDNGSVITDIGACEVGPPVPDFFGTPTSGCAPLEVCFTDASSADATSWSWDFGDGGSSTAQNPCHTYDTPGSYDVALTVCNSTDCDTETKTGYVQVRGVPTAGFSGIPTSGCAPLEVCFTDLSTNDPASWSWDFGDGGSSTVQHPCHTYDTPGSYDVTLTVCNDCGCDALTLNDYVSVSGPPVADFSGTPTTGCAPLAVCFTDLSTYATSWSWDFGDGGSSTAQNPCHTYQNPGLYTVALTACNDCGCDTETKTDYVNVTLVAEFSGTPTRGKLVLVRVPGLPDKYVLGVAFTDLSCGNPTSWFWDFGDDATSDQQNPTHEYQAGRYTVRLTAGNGSVNDDEQKSRYVLVSFTDVPIDPDPDAGSPANHWALNQILACVEERVVGGYPDGTYRPTVEVSRDQMAVFVSRAVAGGDEYVPTGPPTPTFSDVPTGHWAYKYIEYAVDNCVVGGYPDGTYRPDLIVTRDQMAVFVAQAIVGCGGDVPTGPPVPSFPDVPPGYWAYDQIEYCKAEGIVGGYPDGTYRPLESVTRDQMAVYIQRAFDYWIPAP